MEGFNNYYSNKINSCIEEWIELFKLKSLKVKFNNVVEPYINNDDIPYIKFRFVQIDGDYGVCGNTYQNDKTIFIDIDSEENYSTMNGLFELIISHELGHAFGLTHDSNPKSIMYPFISDLDKKVSFLDIINIFEKINN